MKSFLVLSVLVALTHGRPEPPSGYNYPSPSSARHGAPSGGQSQGGIDFSRFSGSGSGIGGGSRFGGASAGSFVGSFATAGGNGGGFGGSFNSQSSSSQSDNGGGFGGSFNSQSGSSQTAQQTSSRQFSKTSSFAGSSADSIVVNKHIYVHVPPPDLEDEVQQKAQVRVPPAQKNYKIIFIKAPTAAASQVPQIPPIPQNEEKTLVYVLVKKPEEQSEIEIPTAAPTEPSKPEVYFIKYKAQKESGGQQGVVGAAEGQDDSVVVEAADRSNSNTSGQRGAGEAQTRGYQNGASAGAYSYSSSSSSNEISRQYGVPSSNGPY